MIRCSIALCLIATSSYAEPVTIRSGEHDSFSRLVFGIGTDSQWSVTAIEGGYQLDLVGPTDGFETSFVFERIPKDRLLEIEQRDQDSVFLAVDCNCHIDAFLWRAGQLVVDIIDGPKAEGTGIETSSDNLAEDNQTNPFSAPNIFNGQATIPSQPRDAVLPTLFNDEPQSLPISETETALLEGLARAASQGFLDAATQDIHTPLDDVVDTSVPEPEDLPGPSEIVGQPGIGISSAMDREFSLIGEAVESLVDQCLASDFFDIGSWANENTFHDQIAAMTEGLVGEFGEEPIEALEDLARLYLYFGFGAEARAVLSADDVQSRNRQFLNELGGVIDDYPGSYTLISSQKGCSTPGALWAFYVDPAFLENEERNYILQQFFAIPQPLRGQIAPRMAQKFIVIDDVEAASKILRSSEGQDVEGIHEVQATRALIAEETNNPTLAIEMLAREASDNARTSPESLIRLIELALEQGQSPQKSDLVLATSMRQEYRNAPVASELEIVEARALAFLGEYREALDLLQERNDEIALTQRNSVYLQLADSASDASFLEVAFDSFPETISSKVENEVSRRLIELGFPERALDFISSSASGADAADRRLLRAQAEIENENYTLAIEELVGMEDELSNVLRSQAFAGLGEYREALLSSNTESSGLDVETLQFRAGAWDDLSADEDEILSDFADVVLTPKNLGSADTLADRRAILSQSQESRRAIEGLLQRFDFDEKQE